MLNHIRIVLVDTSHPGNIGAVARAMKNMCLTQLYLVNPLQFPDAEATSRASGADDLLNQSRVVQSLDQALAQCECAGEWNEKKAQAWWSSVEHSAGANPSYPSGGPPE